MAKKTAPAGTRQTLTRCDGCRWLEIRDPLRPGDCWTAHCMDPDKLMPGKNRTLAINWLGAPFCIYTPAWCRRKERGVSPSR